MMQDALYFGQSLETYRDWAEVVTEALTARQNISITAAGKYK